MCVWFDEYQEVGNRRGMGMNEKEGFKKDACMG